MRHSYSPETDEEVMTICGSRQEDGYLLDVDQTLYNSPCVGFYLMSRHGQIKKDGLWNTALLDGPNADDEEGNCTMNRRVITVFRPMTQDQAILWILDASLPVGTDGRTILLSAYFSSLGMEMPASPSQQKQSLGEQSATRARKQKP